MKEIAPSEIIAWFEAKASEFKNIADTLRGTFGSNGEPHFDVVRPAKVQVPAELILDFVVNGMKKLSKPARCAAIAESAGGGITADNVRSAIETHPAQFEQIGRGWWKLKTEET